MISDTAYNRARAILIDAGSKTAEKSHPKHTQGKGSPLFHGQNLLQEARDEFRLSDAGGGNLRSGMTPVHYNAVHDAAREMRIINW
jgi:hypothetical protein